MAAYGGDRGALSGMSTSQLYEIMSQMKMLVDQNKQQARLILLQNPPLTKALFQAQVMLGMVQPPQPTPSTAPQVSHPTPIPSHTKNVFTQNRQPAASNSPVSPPNRQPHSHLSQPVQQPTGRRTSQPTTMPITPPSADSAQIPGLTQFPQRSSPPPHLHHQPTSTPQPQQPLQNRQYMPVQPPLHSQPRPSQMPAFSHTGQHQTGHNSGFQHPNGPQMHPPQHLFHGQIPHSNQPLPPSVYQAGSPRNGVEFNQGGSSKQPDRGSSWMTTGPPADNATGTQIPGLQPPFSAQMGPTNQSSRPASLSPEMEKALLQQVMSLTPEQINMLPTDQRNQVLQLQQMLRQ